MRRSAAACCAALLAAVLGGCADNDTVYPDGTAAETVRVAFRDGALPTLAYNGTRDAVIKDGPTIDFRNGCFGTEDADTIGAAVLGGSTYERRLLVKMDLSSITDCGSVVAASLSIRIEAPPADSLAIEMLRITRPSYSPWVEGTTGAATGVSWTTVDGAEPWLIEGGDTDGIVLARARIAGDTTVVLRIPPAVAESWIDAPAGNNGLVLRAAYPGLARSGRVRSRESAAAADRPRMDIAYLRGG